MTFGKSLGAFEFDESITDDGVLTWQSQPKQRLRDATIQELINHDDRTEAIHLFLRTRAVSPYTYCGVLGYLLHDEEREQPVHFQWPLLDWPAPDTTIARTGLTLVSTTGDGAVSSAAPAALPGELGPTFALNEVPPPSGSKPGAAKTKTFKAMKRAFHPDQDARNKALGLAGDELVLEVERRQLREAGRSDLAEKVVHVSVVEGDGAGYDIRSFSNGGEVRYLEVKTTRNGATSGFFVSPNEVAFSKVHPGTFVLVRIFGYDPKMKSGKLLSQPGTVDRVVLSDGE